MVERTENYDVVVVGAGNAAACAALAAADQGAKVLVLERAPKSEAGGNTRFTAGAIRFAYNGVEDLKSLMPDLTGSEIEMTDFGVYSEDDFYEDMGRVTNYRTDPELANTLVSESYATVSWMQTKGVRFAPIWGRQAFKLDGKFKFWGGLTVEAWGGGEGLHEAFISAFKSNNIDLVYGTSAKKLLTDDKGVRGVQVKNNGITSEIFADSVVLASGGFQANTEW